MSADEIAFLVLAGRRWENVLGKKGINWNHDQAIIGIFKASSPQKACEAAAIKAGFAGVFFVIPGITWGIDGFETDVQEYGIASDPATSRLDRLERLLEASTKRLLTMQSEENKES